MCGLNGHQFALVSFTHDELAERLPEAGMEKFIKDDPELNEFLLTRVSQDVTVVAKNGKEYTGTELIGLMEHIEKLENRVNDAEMAGTPRDLFLALVTHDGQIDAQSLENQDPALTEWLNAHGYMISLEREESEDDEERLFAVFENTGGHHTRRGMEFFSSRLYRQTWQLFDELRSQCGGFGFTLRRKDGEVPAEDMFGLMPVRDNDGLILLTSANKIVRIGVEDVRSKGRATMGVMLVRLDEGGHVVGFDRVDEGGQTGRDAGEDMDDEPTSALPASAAETPAAGGENPDDAGDI